MLSRLKLLKCQAKNSYTYVCWNATRIVMVYEIMHFLRNVSSLYFKWRLPSVVTAVQGNKRGQSVGTRVVQAQTAPSPEMSFGYCYFIHHQNRGWSFVESDRCGARTCVLYSRSELDTSRLDFKDN